LAKDMGAVRPNWPHPSSEISHIRRGISRDPVVLVVERDGLLRWALYETLTDAGFRVLTAPSCACAESWLRQIDQALSLVLVEDDLWPLARSVRALLEARWPGLPVVVMAQSDDPSLESRMREHGATEVLVKPFDLPDLVAVIERLTGHPHAHAVTSPVV
jgi:two-component system nitrogen regulation response regulator GlnG